MTSRTITKHQFSDQTTIDGNRIEDALQDVQSRFNSLQFKDIDAWVEVPYYWANTPVLVNLQGNGGVNAKPIYYGPWTWVFRSYMPNDIDNEAPNNPFRIKSCSKTDPNTGQPIANPLVSDIIDTSWLWTTTKYFDKPTILNDFTVMGLFDATFAGTDGGYYYPNTWFDEATETYVKDVQVWIIVDNPLNTGDTFIRNNEVHMWGFDEGTFLMSNDRNTGPTNSDGTEFLNYRPDAAVPRANGCGFRLQNLNIPLFAGSRVRFIIGLPSLDDRAVGDFPNNTGQAPGTDNYDNIPWTDNPVPPQILNIWTVNVSTFQPLEKIDE